MKVSCRPRPKDHDHLAGHGSGARTNDEHADRQPALPGPAGGHSADAEEHGHCWPVASWLPHPPLCSSFGWRDSTRERRSRCPWCSFPARPCSVCWCWERWPLFPLCGCGGPWPCSRPWWSPTERCWHHASYLRISTSPAGSAELRVATVNADGGRADARALVELIRTERIDVLTVEQMPSAGVDALDEAGLGALMPYRELHPEYDSSLYSRHPLSDGGTTDVDTAWPQTTAEVTVGGHTVQLVAVHTYYPLGDTKRWSRDMAALTSVARRSGPDTVFLGDFNASLDHSPMRKLLSAYHGHPCRTRPWMGPHVARRSRPRPASGPAGSRPARLRPGGGLRRRAHRAGYGPSGGRRGAGAAVGEPAVAPAARRRRSWVVRCGQRSAPLRRPMRHTGRLAVRTRAATPVGKGRRA